MADIRPTLHNRVWITREIELERLSSGSKTFPAGSCLWIAEDQSWVPEHCVAVYAAGCYGMVNMEWLSLEPLAGVLAQSN